MRLTGIFPAECTTCRQPINWRKAEFTRPDGYMDWCLEAWCDCGPIEDPAVMQAVRAAYDKALDKLIAAQQADCMGRDLCEIMEAYGAP